MKRRLWIVSETGATGATREDETSDPSCAAVLWTVLPMPQMFRNLLEKFVDDGLTNECIGNLFPDTLYVPASIDVQDNI